MISLYLFFYFTLVLFIIIILLLVIALNVPLFVSLLLFTLICFFLVFFLVLCIHKHTYIYIQHIGEGMWLFILLIWKLLFSETVAFETCETFFCLFVFFFCLIPDFLGEPTNISLVIRIHSSKLNFNTK